MKGLCYFENGLLTGIKLHERKEAIMKPCRIIKMSIIQSSHVFVFGVIIRMYVCYSLMLN